MTIDTDHPVQRVTSDRVPSNECCYAVDYPVNPCGASRTMGISVTGSVAETLLRGRFHGPVYTDVSVDADHPVEKLDTTGGVVTKRCCYAVDYTVNP